MTLSDADILQFQALYKNELGIEISREDAYEKGIKLLQLMSAVYKPMTEKEYESIQKHRKNTLQLLTQKLHIYEIN
jgi:hypothetical protein